jgi:hypothetical protein
MRLGVSLLLVGSALALAPAPAISAGNPPSRSFTNVTPSILACMKENSIKKHGTKYIVDATNPNNGVSETHYYGLTRLSYAFDVDHGTVTYTVLQKPGLASYGQIWNGISAAIKACSSGG